MLEKLQFFTIIILCYCFPLFIAGAIVYVYRKFIDKGSPVRDYISGIIFLLGAREVIKNFKFIRRK
jgi:hypothetical protein